MSVMDKNSLKRLFVIGVVTSLVASALMGIAVLLKGSFDDTDWKILATTLMIGIFSITSLANLRNLESSLKSYHAFAVASITISIVGLLLFVGLIWSVSSLDNHWEATLTFLVLAVSSAHASLLLPLRESGGSTQKLIVTTTLACIGVVAGLLVYLIVTQNSDLGGSFYKALGVFAILDVLGTIIAPISSKIGQKPPVAPAPQQ